VKVNDITIFSIVLYYRAKQGKEVNGHQLTVYNMRICAEYIKTTGWLKIKYPTRD